MGRAILYPPPPLMSHCLAPLLFISNSKSWRPHTFIVAALSWNSGVPLSHAPHRLGGGDIWHFRLCYTPTFDVRIYYVNRATKGLQVQFFKLDIKWVKYEKYRCITFCHQLYHPCKKYNWIILMKIVRILFTYISCPYLLTAVMLLYFMTIA